METAIEKRKPLPVLTDLYNDQQLEVTAGQNALNVLLNQPPKPDWIKIHPTIKGHKYIPIERIEYLLTRIFIKWRVEILKTQLIGNSVTVTVRLHVINPITGEEEWQDGIGASPLQTDKDAGAIEFNKMKAGAVMMAAPAAETFAIKDAAEKFGKLFGKDLNRKDEIAYDNLLGTFDNRMNEQALQNELRKTCEDLLPDIQDEDLRQEIVDEILQAQRSGVDTSEFYQRMVDKLSGRGQ